MSTSGLVRRAAAQRASTSFKEQLDSEDEDVGSSSSVKQKRRRTHTDESPIQPNKPSSRRKRADSYPEARPGHPFTPTKRPRPQSPSSSPSNSPGSPRKRVRRSSIPNHPTVPSDVTPRWSIPSLDSHVFVRLDLEGNVFDPASNINEEDNWIWWPGKVANKYPHRISISIVGDFPSGITSVNVPTPEPANIDSFRLPNGRTRFSDLHSRNSVNSTSKKPRPVDPSYVKNWEIAVATVNELQGDDDDDFPDISSVVPGSTKFTSLTSPPSSKAGPSRITKPKKARLPVDPLLTIPGELVFAREMASEFTDYWPARIEAVLDEVGRHTEPKYTVLYCDTTSKDIPRSWFYSQHDKGFTTCKVGKMDSVVARHHVDPDSDDEDMKYDFRQLSPEPLDPPPSAPAFARLDIREQFSYIKPVLQAVLRDEYLPMVQWNDDFMAGGTKRLNVSKYTSVEGMLDHTEVLALAGYIKEWCLRTQSRPLGMSHSVYSLTAQDMSGPAETSTREPSPTPTLTTSRSSPPPQPPPSSLASFKSDDDFPSRAPSRGSETPLRVDIPNDIPNPDKLPAISYELSPLTPMSGEPIEKPPPRTGSLAYQMLDEREKGLYCVDILLYEAKIQLLLWRDGLRRSMTLLSDSIEMDLHDKGRALLENQDWVLQLVEMRERLIRLSKKGHADEGKSIQTGGTASRPKRGRV